MSRVHGANRRRQQTVPVQEWWEIAVRREMKRQNIEQKKLAEDFGVSGSDISRCISRQVPSLGLIVAISRAVGVPFPVLFPESETIAAHLTHQQQLERGHEQLADILDEIVATAEENVAQVTRSNSKRARAPRARAPRVRTG